MHVHFSNLIVKLPQDKILVLMVLNMVDTINRFVYARWGSSIYSDIFTANLCITCEGSDTESLDSICAKVWTKFTI